MGFWSSPACAHTHGIDVGSVVPLVKELHESGWGSLLLLPFRNFEEGRSLVGSDTPLNHLITAWDWMLKRIPNLSQVIIIAHSEGGRLLVELLDRRPCSMDRLLLGAALADSVHQAKRVNGLPPLSLSMMQERFVHWVASIEPLDAPDSRHGAPSTRAGCPCRSAGTSKHELTAGTALPAMMRWFRERTVAREAQAVEGDSISLLGPGTSFVALKVSERRGHEHHQHALSYEANATVGQGGGAGGVRLPPILPRNCAPSAA